MQICWYCWCVYRKTYYTDVKLSLCFTRSIHFQMKANVSCAGLFAWWVLVSVPLLLRLLWKEPVSTSCWLGSTPSCRSVWCMFHLGGPNTTSSMSRTCAVHATPLTSGLTRSPWLAIYSPVCRSCYSLLLLLLLILFLCNNNNNNYYYYYCCYLCLLFLVGMRRIYMDICGRSVYYTCDVCFSF